MAYHQRMGMYIFLTVISSIEAKKGTNCLWTKIVYLYFSVLDSAIVIRETVYTRSSQTRPISIERKGPQMFYCATLVTVPTVLIYVTFFQWIYFHRSLEVLLLLLSCFLVFPGGVYLNRGNHEDTVMNAR